MADPHLGLTDWFSKASVRDQMYHLLIIFSTLAFITLMMFYCMLSCMCKCICGKTEKTPAQITEEEEKKNN